MRYINLDSLESFLSPEWLQKAQKAFDKVKTLPPYERAVAVNGYSHVWKTLKEKLKQLSHKKCWYCESLETRAITDVDHHRPKNAVKECSDHSGYWWLAFDWKNYRYSCVYCNRCITDQMTNITGGKGSHFPLLNEAKRVFNESEPDELLQEEPMLLDPTVAADPLLLTFDLDGAAQPARNQEQFPCEYQRATTSIELYHLNHTDLKERRQFNVCRRVKKLVKDGDIYLRLLQKNKNDVAARQGYRRVVEELSEMINERAEYSAAARAALKTYRNNIWVDELVTAC